MKEAQDSAAAPLPMFPATLAVYEHGKQPAHGAEWRRVSSHQVCQRHHGHIVPIQGGVHSRAHGRHSPQEGVQREGVPGEGLAVPGEELCIQLCILPLEESPAASAHHVRLGCPQWRGVHRRGRMKEPLWMNSSLLLPSGHSCTALQD